MAHIQKLKQTLNLSRLDARIAEVYGCASEEVYTKRKRLVSLTDMYSKHFADNDDVGLYSSPGRTEIGGNHTDHQNGCVLAAAIDLDTIACAAKNNTSCVNIISKGHPDIRVSLEESYPVESEKGTSASIVRGIVSKIRSMGFPVYGFNACVDSNVLCGSGLSSSAAYEVLIGVIINDLFCGGELDAIKVAQIGQYAENIFFGKPCGLMDQLASSVGGVVSIDFANPSAPIVEAISCNPTDAGYALCIVDSGANHTDLTDEYASIPREMCAVASFFGKTVLRDVEESLVWENIAALRENVSDRAVLRAIHFFNENKTAQLEASALKSGDLRLFLSLVNSSGNSSALHLQNLYCDGSPDKQSIPVAIAVARHALKGDGAVRVHGGGFAGTIQAFVPISILADFKAELEAALGAGRCHVLTFRSCGGVKFF